MATKLLVVEDDLATQQYLQTLLEGEGFRCVVSESAEQARILCHFGKPDLIIVDIALPGESGVSLCRELHHVYPNTPTMIFSAVLDKWDEDDILDCGADAVIGKPANAKKILHTIRALLESS